MFDIDTLRIDFKRHSLDNGLNVLLHRKVKVPLVHVSLYYRVGSSYEQAGKSGLAHLFEHMMFQGSESIEKNEHGRYIDNAGGRWNATTNKDRTNYFNTLPSNYLDLALWLEADRMNSLQVTPENFENQRQTVIEERKQSYENRPYGPSYLRFDELAYLNWAYAHSIIGSLEDLEGLTFQDARGFHRRFYGPGNASLVIAGDIDLEQTLERVTHFFGPIRDLTRPVRPDLSEPPGKTCREETVEDALANLPAVSLGFKMPALGTPQYYALSMLALILANGDSSRLYQKLVFDNNWITGLYVGPNQYLGPQIFRIWFQIQNEVAPQKVLEAIQQELDSICRDGVPVEELVKARNQMIYQFLSRLTTVSQVGELLNHYALYYGDPYLVNEELGRFLAVDSETIQGSAQQVFQEKNQTTIFTLPQQRR